MDFQDPRLSTRTGVFHYMLHSLGAPIPAVCDLDHFVEAITPHLRRPTVFLMDEIGVALTRYPELNDAFWESLRALAANLEVKGNLAFVLAAHETPVGLAHSSGHSSPFFNVFGYTGSVGKLEEIEARMLIDSSPKRFVEEDVAWIIEESGCWPILLEIFCRERLFALEEGDMDDGWRAEGLRQIEAFKHLLN